MPDYIKEKILLYFAETSAPRLIEAQRQQNLKGGDKDDIRRDEAMDQAL